MKESKRRKTAAQNCRNFLSKIWRMFSWNDQGLGSFKFPDLLESLEVAWREWEYAKQYFNSVSDPDLIDHAIFCMGATEKKYVYLLKQARENGVNIEAFDFRRQTG